MRDQRIALIKKDRTYDPSFSKYIVLEYNPSIWGSNNISQNIHPRIHFTIDEKKDEVCLNEISYNHNYLISSDFVFYLRPN